MPRPQSFSSIIHGIVTDGFPGYDLERSCPDPAVPGTTLAVLCGPPGVDRVYILVYDGDHHDSASHGDWEEVDPTDDQISRILQGKLPGKR